MLFLWSANLEKGRDKEYQRWITKNVDTYRKRAPKGWKLLGVYGASMSIGRHDVTWIWEFSRYKEIDDMFEMDDPVVNKLLKEEYDFYVPGSMSSTVLRAVKDWRLP